MHTSKFYFEGIKVTDWAQIGISKKLILEQGTNPPGTPLPLRLASLANF